MVENQQGGNSYQNPHQPQNVYIRQDSESNGIGVAGFVISLVTLFLGWIPILGWILWLLGAIFSFVGVFKKPKGLAIAGLVISFLGLIVLIFLFGIILAASAVDAGY